MNGTIFVSPLKTLHVSNFLSSYYSTATTKNAFVDLYENAINFNADSKTNELKQSSIIITFEYTSAWNNTPTSNDSLKYFSMSPLILLPSESQKMKKLQTNLLIAQCFVAVSHPWYITYFHDFIHQAIITTSPSPSSSLSSSSSSFTYTSLFSDFVKWLILTTVNKTTSDSITVVSYPDLRTSTTHSSNNNTSCDNEIELSNTHWKGKRRRKKMSLRKFWTNQVNLQLHIVFGYTHLRQWCITSDLQWSSKLLLLVLLKMRAQALSNWFSTLGGAYSALGDKQLKHAKLAGQLALQQLQIANQLGDEGLSSRCKLFYAYSLMQHGQFKVSERIILRQMRFGEGIHDEKLIVLCKSALAKLSYLKIEKDKNKTIRNKTKN